MQIDCKCRRCGKYHGGLHAEKQCVRNLRFQEGVRIALEEYKLQKALRDRQKRDAARAAARDAREWKAIMALGEKMRRASLRPPVVGSRFPGAFWRGESDSRV